MGRSPPLPHHPQRRRQRGTAGAQYAGRSGLINIKRDDALLHYLTGHYPDITTKVNRNQVISRYEAEQRRQEREAAKLRDLLCPYCERRRFDGNRVSTVVTGVISS